MPEVTTVISTYNRAAMVHVAVASALGQRDVDHEVIVVDNGSTDGTSAVLGRMEDRRLRVIRNEVSRGAPGGRNTGLAAAAGTWVALLDDDDVWAPDKLRAQLDATSSTGRTWSYTGCVYIDGRGRLLGGRPPLDAEDAMALLPFRYTVPAGISSMLWRRDVLDGDGLLDERLVFMTDWDLSLRLARTGPPAVVTRPLVAYRQHGANLSRTASTRAGELAIIAEKHADVAPERAGGPTVNYRFLAGEALRAGARRDALRFYGRAWRGGDLGALLRAPALVVPRPLHAWLRRHFLSEARWLRQARGWLPAGES